MSKLKFISIGTRQDKEKVFIPLRHLGKGEVGDFKSKGKRIEFGSRKDVEEFLQDKEGEVYYVKIYKVYENFVRP